MMNVARSCLSALLLSLYFVAHFTAAQQWQSGNKLPIPLRDSSSATAWTEVYIAGGFTKNSEPNLNLYALDTANLAGWSEVCLMPAHVSGPTALQITGDLLVTVPAANLVTNDRGTNATREVFTLNLTSGSPVWKEIHARDEAIPMKRKGAAAAMVGDVLWIVGGMDDEYKAVLAIDRYSFADEKWLDPVKMNEFVSGCSCLSFVGHRMISFAGCYVCSESLTLQNQMFQVSIQDPTNWDSFIQNGTNPLKHVGPIMGTSVVGQFAFLLRPKMFQAPAVLVFDMMQQQLVVVDNIYGVFTERTDAALVGIGSLTYVAGGQPLLEEGVSDLVDTLSYVPSQRVTCDHANQSYTSGTPITLQTSTGSPTSMLRLSPSTKCEKLPHIADQTVPTSLTAVFDAPFNVSKVTVCVSNGVCPQTGRQKCMAASSSDGVLTSTACVEAFCCWDAVKNECFNYASPGKDDQGAYWVSSLLDLTISAPPVHTPAPPPAPTTASPSGPTHTPRPVGPQPTPNPPTSPPQPSDNKSFFTKPVLYAIGCGAFILVVVVGLCCYLGVTRRKRREAARSPAGLTPEEVSAYHPDQRTPLLSREENAAQATTSKYKIISKLGKGAHGTVYLVRHTKDNKEYAMKYIACDGDDDLQTALKEFTVIRNVQGHENMISLVDMFMNWSEFIEPAKRRNSDMRSLTSIDTSSYNGSLQSAGVPPEIMHEELGAEGPRYVCIVMEYFPEGDLKQWINRHPNPVIPAKEVISIAKQLFALLEYLHSRKPPIVHRDMKPENVLMSGSRAVVTDFGLAHNADRTHMTTRAGTLHYAAPEAWKRNYSSAVDVWSVGCIIYVMCTRRLGHQARVMFSDAMDEEFPDEVREEMRQYPTALVDLTLRLLSLDPKKRPNAKESCEILNEMVVE